MKDNKIFRGGIIVWGNFPNWNSPRWEMSRDHLSSGLVVLRRNCPDAIIWGNFPRWGLPGGDCLWGNCLGAIIQGGNCLEGICPWWQLSCSQVRLSGLWFVNYNEVSNFHDWILCYYEPFHYKVNNQRKQCSRFKSKVVSREYAIAHYLWILPTRNFVHFLSSCIDTFFVV